MYKYNNLKEAHGPGVVRSALGRWPWKEFRRGEI